MFKFLRGKLRFFYIIFFIFTIFTACEVDEPEKEERDSASFVFLNSWGTGEWEYVADGKYTVTENLLLGLNAAGATPVVYVWSKGKNQIKCTVSFYISHYKKSDCEIAIGIGSNSNNLVASKEFPGLMNSLGDTAFANQYISVDISEYFSLLKDNNVYVLIENVYDSSVEVVTVETASLNVWDSSLDPSLPNRAFAFPVVDPGADLSVNDGNSGYLELSSHKASFSMNSLLKNYSKRSVVSEDDLLSMRKATLDELEVMKSSLGVYDKDMNYNEIYFSKFGTGLRPPSDEDWQKFSENEILLDISMAEFKNEAMMTTTKDYSKSKYFPPVGNQGYSGSCASWATGYYVQTYYNAFNNGWDLSGVQWVDDSTGVAGHGKPGYPSIHRDKIMSPSYIFNLVNAGIGDPSQGSYVSDNLRILTGFGVSSWDSFIYEMDVSSTWPGKDAFDEAFLYRTTGVVSDGLNMGVLLIQSKADIDYMVELLDKGYLLVTGVDAAYLSKTYFTERDELSEFQIDFSKWRINHAQVICGYKY